MKMNIKHIAKLANLTLTKSEERFEKQLEETLSYIDKLEEINTVNIAPTDHVTNLENIMREDIITHSLSQDEALANASNTYNGFFVVPAILDQE